MLHPNKSFLVNLSIVMLLLHPVAHAESNGLPQKDNPLQTQIQQLQTQLMDANGKISVLETALNTVNQDINALRDCEACKLNSSIQLEPANTVVQRTANGHGR